ncbi:MAG: ATP-binding protein, partial [Polyangiales bacterium]
LMTNARRYAPAGTPIRLEVSTEGRVARLLVEDGGQGVPDADLPKLGERMRRLDTSRTRKTGGTGLGLSIVRAITDKHDGAVRFRRSSLGGLAVEVELPSLAQAPAP